MLLVVLGMLEMYNILVDLFFQVCLELDRILCRDLIHVTDLLSGIGLDCCWLFLACLECTIYFLALNPTINLGIFG